jgi:ubiquinone/menaquinone biosynthesis C-methylase UbiE
VAEGATAEERLEACDACGGRDLEGLDPVARCLTCGFVFDNPRPTPEAIFRFYESAGKYDHWLDELAGREQMWRARLRLVERIQPGGRLLDVGAGIGQFLAMARGRFEVAGTEVSSEAIAVAREMYDIELHHGTIEDRDVYPAGSFDAVSMIHVLEHVHSPRRTLETCHRLLRPGGHLFVAVPNDSAAMLYKVHHRGWATLARMLTGELTDERYDLAPRFPRIDLETAGPDAEIHLSHFHRASLEGLLGRAGFEVVFSGQDPFYPSHGWARTRDDVKYAFWRAVHALTGCDLWGALFVAARRV